MRIAEKKGDLPVFDTNFLNRAYTLRGRVNT